MPIRHILSKYPDRTLPHTQKKKKTRKKNLKKVQNKKTKSKQTKKQKQKQNNKKYPPPKKLFTSNIKHVTYKISLAKRPQLRANMKLPRSFIKH